MTFAVSVAGGTGAGCKHVKERESWECDCPGEVVAHGLVMARLWSGYRYSCPDCGARNPQCVAPTAS